MGLLADIAEQVEPPQRVSLLDLVQQIEPYTPKEKAKKGFWKSNIDAWRIGGLNLAKAVSGLFEYVGPPESMRKEINVTAGMNWTLPGEEFGEKVDDLIARHPEWQNEQPKNFWDLITSPTKLSSAIAPSMPVMIASGVAIAGGQPQIAMAIMFEAEGQEAYRQAIQDGATEEQAQQAKVIYGSVAAILEFAQTALALKLGKIGWRALRRKVTKEAGEYVAKRGAAALTKDVLLGFVGEGAEEITQGSWQAVTAKLVYDKPIIGPDGVIGFIDQRAQEFVVAGAMSLVGFGGGATVSLANRAAAKMQGKAYPGRLDIQDKGKFKDVALTPEGAMQVAALSPGVSARIAEKKEPSRKDLKELGIAGWSAEERSKFAGLLKDALNNQEQLMQTERVIERVQEEYMFQQRTAEKADFAELREKAEQGDVVAKQELERRRREMNVHPLGLLTYEEQRLKEKENAERAAQEIAAGGAAEGIEGQAPGQVRLRDDEKARLEAEAREIGQPPATEPIPGPETPAGATSLAEAVAERPEEIAAKIRDAETEHLQILADVTADEPEMAETYRMAVEELARRKATAAPKSKGVKISRQNFETTLDNTGQATTSEGERYTVVAKNDGNGFYVQIEKGGLRRQRGPVGIEQWDYEDAVKKAVEMAFGTEEIAFPKSKGLKAKPAAEGENKGVKAKSEQYEQVVNKVAALLRDNPETKITNAVVNALAREVYGAAAGNARDTYDAVEAGMNKHITESGIDLKRPESALAQLLAITDRMPRQNRRDEMQVELQQFSTPPAEAYVAVRAAAIKPGMSALEPSAGTGNIATLMRLAGAWVETNEIDARRRSLLESLGFKAYNVNAEQLDNLLEPGKEYDVIVMNPPFSATGGRVKAHKTKFGARHVEQALFRLKKGGRLVAIVGQGMALDRANFRDWWGKIEEKYNVRANIGMSGKDYGKFGTTFGNQIVIIDNDGATKSEGQIVTGADLSPQEALKVLGPLSKENVNERIRTASQDEGGEVAGRVGGAAKTGESVGATGGGGTSPTREPGTADTSANHGPRVVRPVEEPGEPRPTGGPDSGQRRNIPAVESEGTPPVGGGVSELGNRRVKKKLTEHLSPEKQAEINRLKKKINDTLTGKKGLYSGIDPALLLDGVKLGAMYAEAGIRSFADWSARIMEGMDEKFRPYLAKIYQNIRQKHSDWGLDSDAVIEETQSEESVKETTPSEVEEGTPYSTYQVQKATVKGSQLHPADIVESTVMSSVTPPDITYKHHLPKEIVTEGRVSDVQLEAVVYAGQTHQTILPDGKRAGFWIGDGTGLGKGREIYAVILDNLKQGRKKAVHISASHQLVADAQRDKDGVGVPLKLIHQKPFHKNANITADEGVFFTTYGMLAKGYTKGKERFKQLCDWLGPDFDGVIAFDETHKMKNAAATTQGGGYTAGQGTQQGNMGIELQRLFPKARILYVSATGASEVRHLIPLERLGLWGERAAFPNFIAFANAMQQGGVANMEMLSRELKLLGKVVARTISYEGVEYAPLEYGLSGNETKQFDEIANFWGELNKAFEEANRNASRRALGHFSSFYSAQQRFFLQLMMGYELPSVVKAIEKDLSEGRSAVVNLYNTNETVTKRLVNDALEEGVSLDEMEFSPRQMLVDLVKRHFPLEQYEEVTDPQTGRTRRERILDGAGNPVINRQNLRKQEELLAQIADMSLPTNPLDALIEHFGAGRVAEITGRTRRMENGKYVRRKIKGVKQTQLNEHETELFQQGKKRIAIISGAGSTGISLHADLTKKNQQRRVFYAFQLSWSADTQMQSFGRVHRSFQATAPIIRPVTLNLAGQMRLTNAVSRRLAALGAITKGERSALGGSMFNVEDLTDSYGVAALTATYNGIMMGEYANQGVGRAVIEQMGLLNEEGDLARQNTENVDRFLNRIMALPVDIQNGIFEIFYGNYQEIIARAKETGAFDFGVEQIHATNLKVVGEPTVVHTDEASGAQTKLYELEGDVAVHKINFDQATRFASRGFYKNKKSGHIYAVQKNENPLATSSNALHLRNVRAETHAVSTNELHEKYEKVLGGEAKVWWDTTYAKTPAFRPKRFVILSGPIFSIYDKIMGRSGLRNKRIQRATLKDGRGIVGLGLKTTEVAQIRQRLGIGNKLVELTASETIALVKDGAVLELDNGWQLTESAISGDKVIELLPSGTRDYASALQSYGFLDEVIRYKRRWFAIGRAAESVVGRLLRDHKVVRDITSADTSALNIHKGARPRITEESEEIAASYSSEPPETKKGKSLLDKLRRDTKQKGKKKVGLRSIVDFVNEQVKALMLVGKTQTTRRSPAHFEPGPHTIRTKSGTWQLNFHEAGHALSALIGDENPAWFAHISKMLIELTGPDTMASAQTPEEGMAELVRLYITDPGKIPDALKAQFESVLKELRPELLAGLRDAHRAYVFQKSRPVMEQLQTQVHDKPKGINTPEQVSNMAWGLLQNAIGDSMIVHRVHRRTFNAIAAQNRLGFLDVFGVYGVAKSWINKDYRSQLKLARDWKKHIEDTPADTDAARNDLLRVPQAFDAAINGAKGEGDGIVVKATGKGFERFSKQELSLLREVVTLPENLNPGHGNSMRLYPKSLNTIKHEVGLKDWEDFCTYGQARASLERAKKKGHEYAGRTEGLTPADLEKFIREQESSHPEWDGYFKEVNQFMNHLLLVPLLAGEKTPGEFVTIIKAWEDYWPLQRQIEGKPGGAGGITSAKSSGIYSAFGSALPLKTLDDSVRFRTRRAFDSYYWHRFAWSMVRMAEEANKRKDMPLDARMLLNRLMIPLRLEPKKVAKLTEHEMQVVIADYLNKQQADQAGLKVEELDEPTQPDDVAVCQNHTDIWRMKKPNAVRVLSLWGEDGNRHFFQVPDPYIFRMYARQRIPGDVTKHITRVLMGMTRPWKRTKTQKPAFGVRNIPRDITTGQLLAEGGPQAYIPAYNLALGVLNRITGKSKASKVATELMSKRLDELMKDSHRTVVQSFGNMLAQDIAPKNWTKLSTLEKIEEIPGQLVALGLKPLDIKNWILGSRYASALTEELPREGAYEYAEKKSESESRRELAYDKATGYFAQRGSNPVMAAIIAAAGFLNPRIQILGQVLEKITDPDPKVRAMFMLVRAPLIAAQYAALCAMAVTVIKALWPDPDDQKEIFDKMRERPYKNRVGYMSILGQVRIPFDYGIGGAIASLGWNVMEGHLLKDPVPSWELIKGVLLRSSDLPGASDFLQPHIKTAFELHLNHAFYFNDEIVPAWMLEKYSDDPERQAWPSTPELYKKAGKVLGVSPLKIQYALRSMFDDDLNEAVRMIDSKPYESPSDWPIMGKLVTRPSEGYGSQSVKTVADLDSQWSILRSRLRYMQETGDTDEAKSAKLEQQINQLTIAHQVMHELDDLYQGVKVEYKKAKPDIQQIRTWKKEMTTKARKFMLWDKGGRKGKLPSGIISEGYRRSLMKQAKIRPSKRRRGEPYEDYQARRQKVLNQKQRAMNLLILL